MAVTPDGLPCIGFLRPGLVVVGGCNGYGGSYMVAAGSAAADMVLSDGVPEWVPDDVFSPRRLLHDKPLFLTERDGLWRVAASLTRQLLAVDRKVSEALTLSGTVSTPLPRSIAPMAGPPGASSPAGTIAPERLRSFASFSAFSHQEIRRLLRLMRRWDLPKDTAQVAPASSWLTGRSTSASTRAADSRCLPLCRPEAYWGRSVSSPAHRGRRPVRFAPIPSCSRSCVSRANDFFEVNQRWRSNSLLP